MPRSRRQSRRNQKVLLDLDAATEMADLIADEPGTADEALLDEALDAIAAGRPYLPADAQRRARDGRGVAIELSPEATEAMQTLIRHDTAASPRLLRRVGDRLRYKIDRARQRIAGEAISVGSGARRDER